MAPASPAWSSVRELTAALDAEVLTCEALIGHLIQRIERLNPRAKALISVAPEQAMAQARAEDAARREGNAGPLSGIPFAVKDMIDVAGMRTTAGSRVTEETAAERDATCVARLREAGAICLGKANLHEFAYGATGENALYGTAVNAYDPDCMACGSSSGSAAAVAFGLVPAALGTDTGGSTRAPAVLNGLVGLKPTHGRISEFGVIPFSWSMDHVGTMTRRVGDAALLLEIMAGHDEADPDCSRAPVPRYRDALSYGLSGLKIGLPDRFFFERIDPEIDRACQQVIDELERGGASLRPVRMPALTHSRTVGLSVQMPEALSYHSRNLESRGHLYAPDFRAGLAFGQFLLAEHYLRGKRMMTQYRQAIDAVLSEVDLILTPATPLVAPRMGTVGVAIGGVNEALGNAVTRFTHLFNMTGHPALTMPVAMHSLGLPMGVQLIGRHFEESTVFAAAQEIETLSAPRLQLPQLEEIQ